MVNEGPCFESETHIKLVKSLFCPLPVCEQDKAASQKGSVLHTKISIKELGTGKEHLQHNIVDLSSGTPTPDR